MKFTLMKCLWSILIIWAVAAIIVSCSEDEGPTVETHTVQFSNTTSNLAENASSPLIVNLSLSSTLEEAASVTISVAGESTATDNDYSTDPPLVSESITLPLSPGATSASFKVTPVDNSILNDDKKIIFKLTSADGGIELAGTNLTAQVDLINNDTTPASISTSVSSLADLGTVDNGGISDSKSYTVSGTGLTDDITVSSISDYFMVSLDNVDFSTSVEVPYDHANSGPVDVFVQFLAISGVDQVITGAINHSSDGAEDLAVTVSGTESGNAAGGLLLDENFDYGSSTGNLTALSAWENYSGTDYPIQYLPDGLSFPEYANSDIGGAVAIENGNNSREDVVRSITSQNSGTVYVAQLINVKSATFNEIGDFFLSLRDQGGAYYDRLYAKDDGNGNLLLGTARTRSGEGLEVYSSVTYSYNTTYLVVIKYDFSTKVTSMFVLDDSLPDTEPATPDVVANTGSEPTSLEDIIIRQSSDEIAATIDGIRIANTWNDVLGL